MDVRLTTPWPTGAWKKHLADAVIDVDELIDLLHLDVSCLGARAKAMHTMRSFALRVPRGFVSRMRPGDPDDPLLRQVLPIDQESKIVEGFTPNPVGELDSRPDNGVLHKYRGRALVLATGTCAIHCRYCFRRHFPYSDCGPDGDWTVVTGRIASDPEISEVILSGGDPLTLANLQLESLTQSLTALPQIRRLRIHTRLPVVLPQRVDEGLVRWIEQLETPTVVVVHANHPHEIDDEVRRGLAVLGATGATVLNQAVLLRGVNDNVAALADLSETLFDVGVLPYYLHMLDPVAGAAHFEVSETVARGLMSELSARLPGYLVPRLVHEMSGAPAKVVVGGWERL
jgi:EF-P beta-lysylation protein EpmB